MIPRGVKYVTPHHYSQIFLKICYLCKKGMKELLPSNVKLRLQCEACKTKDRQKLGYFLVTKEKLMSWISLVICFLFPQGPHHQSGCQVNLGPFLDSEFPASVRSWLYICLHLLWSRMA